MFGNRCTVRLVRAAVQNSSMHIGMQSFDPAVEHLGKSSEFGNISYGDVGIAQQLGRSRRRNQFHTQAGELAGEIDESGFVGDAENGALDLSWGHECL